jgi:hypothetical protein
MGIVVACGEGAIHIGADGEVRPEAEANSEEEAEEEGPWGRVGHGAFCLHQFSTLVYRLK